MIEIPSLLESKQTVYSAIPLALNTASTIINEYYKKRISTHSSDYLVLALNEMPASHFQYHSSNIPILFQDTSSKIYDSKQRNNIANEKKSKATTIAKDEILVPFTSILVGPSYTCQALMEDYFQWGLLQENLFHSNDIEYKKQKSTKKSTKKNRMSEENQSVISWQKIIIPKVWAQSTLSHVKVTCMEGQALQKELRRIFNYPITVSAVAPPIHTTHNEMLAWLFAMYTASIARKIFRTVICDSNAIEHQFQLWRIRESNDFYPLKDICECRKKLETEFCQLSLKHHKHFPSIKVPQENKDTIYKTNTHTNTKKYLLHTSEYSKKKHIYSHIDHPFYSKHIGFSSQNSTLSLKMKKNTQSLQQNIIKIKRQNTYFHIELPITPCVQTQAIITALIAKLFPKEQYIVLIKETAIKMNPFDFYIDNCDIVSSLILLACKKLIKYRSTQTFISLDDFFSLELKSSIAFCLELETSIYSQKIHISTVHIVVHSDPVVQDTIFKGSIEYSIIETLHSLLGVQSLQEKTKWNLRLLKEKETSQIFRNSNSVGSLPFDFHQLVQNAIVDAFTTKSGISMQRFPALERI